MKTTAQHYVDAIMRGDLGAELRLQAELMAEQDADNERLTAPDALHKAARWYAGQGIAVFPCVPPNRTGAPPYACSCADADCRSIGKHPYPKTNGFKAATTDRAQIDAWWTARPASNIGAPTGILFDVVDIDGREGVLSIYTGPDPTPLDEIGHSLTSREAGHHAFIAPTGLGNRASFKPGVDYRGVGGYVILPPSIGANGKRYQWSRPLQVAR